MKNARPFRFFVAHAFLVALLAAGCSVELAATTTSTTTGEVATEGSEAAVVRVIDGDSLELKVDGEVVEARLAGVNAPELSNDQNQRTCAGEKAKEALEAIVAGQKVSVEGEELDRFGRLLVELTVDSESVSDVLSADGWLLVTDNNSERRKLVRSAADQMIGWFGSACGEADTRIGISSVRADAPGNDRQNLTEELIELINQSEEPVDLAGWVLRDETTGHIFTIPAHRLEPGETVNVRTGEGTNTASDLFLNESFPVWSNDFETVLLIDPKGVVAEVVFLIEVGE